MNRSYRGYDEADSAVYISGQKRGVVARIGKCLNRRQTIEPIIGHLKHDGWSGRKHLKDTQGVSMNVRVRVSCAGYNPRVLLKRFRDSCTRYFLSLNFSLDYSPKTSAFRCKVRCCRVKRSIMPFLLPVISLDLKFFTTKIGTNRLFLKVTLAT